MNISIMVCTWNRAAYLEQCLARMQLLRIPSGLECEILIVNNNCTDSTDEVIARHAKTLPIRRLFEPQPGKSNAANRGILEAKGELIICSDDDVSVSCDWVAHYAAAARDYPDASFFGGTIDPKFEVEPPKWIKDHLVSNGPYSVLQHGPDVRPFLPGEVGPYGANMAIRSTVFKQFTFDSRLGPIRDQILPADDGEFFFRLRKAGHKGVWVGPAQVEHFIAKELLTSQYVWHWHIEQGRTQVLRAPIANTRQFLGTPCWLVREYCYSRLNSWLLYPWKNKRWARCYTEAARTLGMIYQYRSKKAKIAGHSFSQNSVPSAIDHASSDRS